MKKRIDIESGTLDLNIVSVQKPYSGIDDLLAFAARQNSKRKFLFVSKILGKHIPVKPSEMRASYDCIANLLGSSDQSTYVIGMAETAIGLGGGVADSLSKMPGSGRVLYQNTTRHYLDCDVWFQIQEEHCHAPSHIVYEPLPELKAEIESCKRVVLVDDEISTGKTLVQLAKHVVLMLGEVKELHVVSLVNWLDEDREKWFGETLSEHCNANGIEAPHVRFHQLAKGSFEFSQNDSFTLDLPQKTDKNIETRASFDHCGRRGLVMPIDLKLDDADSYAEIDKPISVIGYCEHILFPFIKAEMIEKMGKDVVFQSYTRSPIFVDKKVIASVEVVPQKRGFSEEFEHYIYNVDRNKYHIINEYEMTTEKTENKVTAAIFTDIDDTLLSSKGKIPEDVSFRPVAVNKDGDFVGFSTQYQLDLIDMLCANGGLLIPVTGRNKDTLYCYQSKWAGPQIVSHGAIVLNKEGEVDPQWLELVGSEIETAKPLLARVLLEVTDLVMFNRQDDEGRVRTITDQGIDAYFCAKYRDSELLDRIEQHLIDMKKVVPGYEDWVIHRNGRNIAFLPTYASKVRAVQFVKEKLGITKNDLTIGIGDSHSDLKFMHECTYCMYPQKSQIKDKLTAQEIV